MKVNKTIIFSVLLIILALGGGFFAGVVYQKGKIAVRNGTFAFGQNGQMMRGRFGQSGQNIRPIRGEVVSLDTNSMTVKLPNGNSVIVIFGTSAQFAKSSSASASDVKNGDTVMIIGVQNNDGTVTAQSVAINPPNRFGSGR